MRQSEAQEGHEFVHYRFLDMTLVEEIHGLDATAMGNIGRMFGSGNV